MLATADGNPFVATGVIRIDADLTSDVMPSAKQVLGPDQIRPDEQAMATDPEAWFALVLLGQALVLAAGLVSWARYAWGAPQAFLVGLPVLVFLGIAVADQAVQLLPNLM